MNPLPSLLTTGLRLLVFPLGLLLCHNLPAAVTFTNTPSSVSNTYGGIITLTVGGLTNGETVVIQKFIDLNTNSVIDGSDWLLQQFQLTDGQAGMVIGGIVNSNVPGDTDSTAGQITSKINFRSGDFVQNIAGRFLYKLSSPTARFTPITNLFTVTNFPYAQKFTGNVISNNTSTTVPNAVVLMFPPPRPGNGGPGGSPLAGAVANNSGSYTIPVPEGTYMPVALKSNYLANLATPLVLTLAASQTITTNLTLTNATASISGKVVDAANTNIGLPGILLPAESANGLMGITFTDTNGNYSLRVQSGQWGIGADDFSLIVHGYVGLQSKSNFNSGTTNNLSYPKATALFYGSVKDNLGNPLPGIDIYAYDNGSNLYETDGYTDTNGNYFAAVLGGLGTNDLWWLQIRSDSNPTNYVFSQPAFNQNGGTNVSVGTAVQADFTALLATNHIIGNVQANGTNIAGVGVWASIITNSANFFQYANTDANGNYWLNVGNGSWAVGVNCNGGSDSLDNILGAGTYICPNSQTVIINGNNATNNFIVQPCGGVVINTTNLPAGEINVYYNQFLQASSCYNPFNWSVMSGSLPSGLTLASNGEIYGTPTNAGPFNFTVQVTDGNSQTTNQALSLTIIAPLRITTASLPNATQNAFYSTSLSASGGQLPYIWSLAPASPPLPAGLNLSTNGLLSGTLGTNGVFSFNVRVTDFVAQTADTNLSLTISNNLKDVVVYYVTKLKGSIQTDATTIVPDTVGAPYHAYLGIIQSALGAVPIANVTLPTSVVRGLPWGSSAIELQWHETFADQSAADSAYPSGNYNFGLYAVHDGLMYPTVNMPAVSYPSSPHISNFAPAQAINPTTSFLLQWDSIPGATANDSLWLIIANTNGSPVFSTPYPAMNPGGALPGTATSVLIPTSTLQLDSTYTGVLTFFQPASMNTTNYPGATGVGIMGAKTSFPLVTLSLIPRLSQPARFSTNQFQFLVNGLAGQNYTIQGSSNLINWDSIRVTNAPADVFLIQLNQATNSRGFYRLLLGP